MTKSIDDCRWKTAQAKKTEQDTTEHLQAQNFIDGLVCLQRRRRGLGYLGHRIADREEGRAVSREGETAAVHLHTPPFQSYLARILLMFSASFSCSDLSPSIFSRAFWMTSCCEDQHV